MALGLQIRNNTRRWYSTFTKIALTNDESTYVAWHPKQEFPYECTVSLPESKTAIQETVLKNDLTPQLKEIFNKKSPELIRQELMNITYTTKHKWFPKSNKKAKKTEMDRQYL